MQVSQGSIGISYVTMAVTAIESARKFLSDQLALESFLLRRQDKYTSTGTQTYGHYARRYQAYTHTCSYKLRTHLHMRTSSEVGGCIPFCQVCQIKAAASSEVHFKTKMTQLRYFTSKLKQKNVKKQRHMAHTRNAHLNLLPTFWQVGSHRDTTKQVAEQRCKNNVGKSSGTCSLR